MKRTMLLTAAAILMVSGCAKENFQGRIKSSSGIKCITATIDNDCTRTLLKESDGLWRLIWLETDEIGVVCGEDVTGFAISEGVGTAKAKFISESELPMADVYYAVSPADYSAYSSGDTLYTRYEEELIYNDANGNVEGSNLMVAQSLSTDFAFRNLCAYINLEIKSASEETIRNITVSAMNGAAVAGEVAVSFDENGKPSVKAVSQKDGGKIINVDCCSAISIGPAATAKIAIPVLPLFDEGFIISIMTDSGKAMTVSSSQKINSGEILLMPAIDFVATPVAAIGGEEYYSFDSALEAATDITEDVTIRLLANCRISESGEVYNPNFTITVDLNGHTLTAMVDKVLKTAKTNKLLIIDDSSETKSGKITNVSNSDPAIKLYGPAILKGGLIETSYRGVYVYDSWFKAVGGGIHTTDSYCVYANKVDAEDAVADSVIVDGKEVSFVSDSSYAAYMVYGDFYGRAGSIVSKSTIALYEFNGTAYFYDDFYSEAFTNVIAAHRSSSYNALLTVYGGRFNSTCTTSSYTPLTGHLTTDSTKVYGGFFTSAPNSAFIPAGYMIQAIDTVIGNVKYRATVVEAPAVAATVKIGDGAPIDKGTVNEAFKAAINAGQSALITLAADCSFSDSVGINKACDVTLDLNGHTLTWPGTNRVNVRDPEAKLTIKTSVDGGNIFQSNPKSNTFIITGGTVTLESGSIKADGSIAHVYVNGDAKFIMNGGVITTANYYPVVVQGNSEFIMNGGELICRDTTQNCLRVNTPAVATINGGTFTMPAVSYNGGIIFAGSGKISIEGGDYSGELSSSCSNLEINAGTFTATTRRALRIEGGTTTINDGLFKASYTNGTIQARGNGTLEINGGEIISEGDGAVKAIFNGDNVTTIKTKGYLTVNGGTITSSNYGIASYFGTTTVKDGTVNAKTFMICNNGSTPSILGGHFNKTDAESPMFTFSKAKGLLQGGWFTEAPADSTLNEMFRIDDSKTIEKDGVTYSYHVVENAGLPALFEVNGTEYTMIERAMDAAREATSDVTMKLVSKDTVLFDKFMDFTNENGKEITLDLNGGVIRGMVDSLITTKGVLTITDSSEKKSGNIIAAKRRIVFLGSKGTVNLKGCTIICENKQLYQNANSYASAVVVFGGSTTHEAVLNVSDGARIITDNCIKPLYVGNGSANFENCEITCHREGLYHFTDGRIVPYYSMYVSTKADITINDGASFRSVFTPGADYVNMYPALYCGSADAKVTINGGYFHGPLSINGSATTITAITLKGGYFNAPLSQTPKYGQGLSFQKLDTPVKHTHDGVELEYSYQVK